MLDLTLLKPIAVFNVAPIPAPRMVRSDKYAKRPIVVKYFEFRNTMRVLALQQKFVLPQKLYISFHLKMPDSWSVKNKKYFDGKPHQQTPDIDNLSKSFMDSLCSQDSYVHTLFASKVWSYSNKIVVYYA